MLSECRSFEDIAHALLVSYPEEDPDIADNRDSFQSNSDSAADNTPLLQINKNIGLGLPVPNRIDSC